MQTAGSILQLVENKLMTMRTEELAKKNKIANDTVEERKRKDEGKRAGETPSIDQDTSESGEVRCSAVGSGVTVQSDVWVVTCCFSLPY